MRFLILAAVAAFALAVNVAPAMAEKGVKKNANGERVVHGTVMSVQAGNNGQSTFVMHVHHPKAGQNAATAAQAGKGVGQAKGARSGKGKKGHTITVSQNTKFEVAAGGKSQTAQQGSFSQLKAGEQVTVHLKGKEAEKVVIHTHTKGKKKAAA